MNRNVTIAIVAIGLLIAGAVAMKDGIYQTEVTPYGVVRTNKLTGEVEFCRGPASPDTSAGLNIPVENPYFDLLSDISPPPEESVSLEPTPHCVSLTKP